MRLLLSTVLLSCTNLFSPAETVASPTKTAAYVNEIFITNFKIEDTAQPVAITPARFVTYSLKLSKPHGYHGYVYVRLILGYSKTVTDQNPADASLTVGRSTPPDIASFPADSWVDGRDGRDYYEITATYPTPNSTKSDAGFNTQRLGFSDYTYIYAIAVNQNTTNYANPNELRGVSAGIAIARTVCVSNNNVQNITVSSGQNKVYSAGDVLLAGNSITSTKSTGDVVVNSGGSLVLNARNQVALLEGVSINTGGEAQLYLDSNVCTSSARTTEDTSQSATATRSSEQSQSSTSLPEEQSRVTMAYPNPVSEILTLPKNTDKVMLLNLKGMPVRASTESGRLNVQSLPDGLYNLQIQQNGKIFNQHIQIKH